MNIFDAHVSGSLSVSGSAEFSGDLTVLGTINATISGTTSNAITAAYAPNYTLTSSFDDFTSSYTTGSFTGSFSGSFTGSVSGDGSNLYNIPASGVTGLNLTKIVSGSVSASLSPSGFGVNADSNILGSLTVQNGITGSADFNTLVNKPTLVSGSSQITISDTTGYSSFSGSIAAIDSNQDGRLTSIESKTGSYAVKTTSNSFIGDQTITGSLIVTQNLTVLGSSSLLIVTSSQLAVSSSIISVNVFEPAERFGGLKVYDSGSSNATASLLWDSLNNKWIYQNVSGSGYSGGMFMMGPRNNGSLGDEVGTIANVVMKGQGGDHITGSNITDDGSLVTINSNTTITGSVIVTSTISSTNITSIETATSSLNSFTSSINTTIKNKLNSDGVISGSSQVLLSSGIWSGSAQLPSGVVSGSSQIVYSSISSIPSGIVSGSSQITLSSTTGFGTYLNQAVLTTSTPTFSGIKGSSYFDAQASSGFRIRNSADSANVGGFTRRGLWEGNSNYDPSIWCETNYGFYIYTNGSATVKTMVTPGGSLLHGHTQAPSETAWLGTGVFGVSGYNKVILGSLNSTTTGAYVGGHNSALSAWADLNVAGDNVIFRYQQTETMRINTSGHLLPANNGTQNLGGSSNRWNTVFTSDLSMSNGIGDYTIVEGEEDLFIYNNKTNKVFKFLLQEVDPSIAPPKKTE